MSYRLVAIGTSWGGLRALGHLLASLPENFPAALVIAQHRSPDGPRDAMWRLLDSSSSLPVREVEDKDPIEPGHVYLAPADYDLIVEPGHFSLSLERSRGLPRPSVDVLFETAADSYGSEVIAIVLTGLMDDGAQGIVAVKREGGLVIAQHPDSAEKAEMPTAAIETGLVDRVLALGDIAPALAELVTLSENGTRR